jgi:hypothetical protein
LVREPILDGRPPAWSSYAWAAGIALASTFAASVILAKLQRRLIFKL